MVPWKGLNVSTTPLSYQKYPPLSLPLLCSLHFSMFFFFFPFFFFSLLLAYYLPWSVITLQNGIDHFQNLCIEFSGNDWAGTLSPPSHFFSGFSFPLLLRLPPFHLFLNYRQIVIITEHHTKMDKLSLSIGLSITSSEKLIVTT